MALEQQLLRLAEANIQLVPAEMSTHYVVSRDGFVCLIEKREGGFGSLGSVCKLAGDGFAVVTFDGERAWFVTKGQPRTEASPDELNAYRDFARDVRAAIEENR